jgi:hypothetical protein
MSADASGQPDGERRPNFCPSYSDGLQAVEAACAEALREGVHSADVIINILARRRQPEPAKPIAVPESLQLQHPPTADCSQYDSLRSIH